MSIDKAAPARANLADVVVGVVCLVLQLVLGGHVSLFGAVPDFLLSGVFFIALRHGRTCGAVAGFASGLLFDLLGAATVGLSALIATLFGYLVPVFSQVFKPKTPVQGAMLFAGMSLAYNLVYCTLMLLLGDMPAQGLSALGKVVASVLMDTLVAFLILWVHHKLTGPKGERIKL